MRKRRTRHERDCELVGSPCSRGIMVCVRDWRVLPMSKRDKRNVALARIVNRALAAHRKGKRDATK